MSSVHVSTVRAAGLLLVALVACRSNDSEIDVDVRNPDGGGYVSYSCESDDDCDSGSCCLGDWLVSRMCMLSPNPTDSVCSLWDTGGNEATCLCYPPQLEPVCPNPYKLPPFEPDCPPIPWARCAVFCSDPSLGRVCECDTTAEFTLLDGAGVEVPTCPPTSWEAVCPSEAGIQDAGDAG